MSQKLVNKLPAQAACNPLLKPAQAARFGRAQVLAQGGPLSCPQRDNWLPNSSPQATWVIHVDPSLPPDPPHRVTHPQEAVTLAVALALDGGHGGVAEIVLAPGRHAGPLILPVVPLRGGHLRFALRGAGAQNTTLSAAVDAEMPGTEFRDRFDRVFALACAYVRPLLDTIASRDTLSTAYASVLRVEATDTTISDLTVINSYACDRPAAAPEGALPNAQGVYSDGQHQAVALLTRADRVHVARVTLRSLQDTLYVQGLPGLITRVALEDCHIEGDVDFIFGQATAHFARCRILSLGHRAATTWATAPATPIRAPYGFVFVDCDFRAEGAANAASGQTYLGRQWFEGVRASPYLEPHLPDWRVTLGEVSEAIGDGGGTISRATLESAGKCVILRSRIDGGYNPIAPWTGWSSGQHDRAGQWHDEAPHPRFRPVQTCAGDFLERLGPWLAREGDNYTDLDPAEPWLGLFDCRIG